MNQTSNEYLDDVTHMEDEAKYTIITMEDEEESTQATKILTDCKDAVTRLYLEFREWYKENQDSEEMQARKAKLKRDSDRLIAMAKEQMRKLQENEDLRYAVKKGTQVATDTGTWVLRTLSDGVNELRESEGGQRVEAMVQSVKEDERVKQGVASFKKGTLKLAESAFEGLKKVLDEKHPESSESETEVDNEKNNNL